jgi:hypothetical protein
MDSQRQQLMADYEAKFGRASAPDSRDASGFDSSAGPADGGLDANTDEFRAALNAVGYGASEDEIAGWIKASC